LECFYNHRENILHATRWWLRVSVLTPRERMASRIACGRISPRVSTLATENTFRMRESVSVICLAVRLRACKSRWKSVGGFPPIPEETCLSGGSPRLPVAPRPAPAPPHRLGLPFCPCSRGIPSLARWEAATGCTTFGIALSPFRRASLA